MNNTDFIFSELNYLWPEILLFIGGGVVLVLDAFSKDEAKFKSYIVTQAFLVLALIVSLFSSANQNDILQGHYASDSLGSVSRSFILAIAIAALAYAKDFLMANRIYKSEFYVLAMYATLGMLVMVSAGSLISLYLGVEMLALSTYVLTAFNRDSSRGSEAAMKYFILGAVASGLILYGMSMAYGATGSLSLAVLADKTASVVQGPGTLASDMPLMLAMVFMLAGILFKLGAVPFHMWLPDVYQGAPAGSVALMSAAPKIAYLIILIRVLIMGFESAAIDWQPMILVVATLSIILGNLAAIVQTEIKRMLAYSTIAHVGFILLGLYAFDYDGLASSYFYVITYAIAAVAAMSVVIVISHSENNNGDVQISQLRGLNKQHPGLAFVLLISMMSMAGIPAHAGFIGKFAVISAILSSGLIWLGVLAIVFSVIGAFYYLRVVKVAYFDDVSEKLQFLALGTDSKVLLTVNAVLILLLGLMPQQLLTLCQSLFS